MIENWIIWIYGIGCIIEMIIIGLFLRKENQIIIADAFWAIVFIIASWISILSELIVFKKEIMNFVIWRRKK